MKFLEEVSNSADGVLKDMDEKKPLLLTVCGIVGFVATVIEVAYAKPKADLVIKDRHSRLNKKETKVEEIVKDTVVAMPIYLPAVLTGGFAIGCIAGSYKVSSERTAAMATAYTLTETKLKEYQNKVIETLGEKKEQKIRDEIASDKVKKNPPTDRDFVLNENSTLMYDSVSGRYFRSEIDTIKNARDELNQRIYSEMYISLNDFYYEINLDPIGVGDDLGWNVEDGMIDIDMRWAPDGYKGEPCLVLDFLVRPRYNYGDLR